MHDQANRRPCFHVAMYSSVCESNPDTFLPGWFTVPGHLPYEVTGTLPIDIRDYVNGIGNRSREPYIRARTPCYSLHPVVRRC